MPSSKYQKLAIWALACAACVAMFSDAFSCWFLMDDFAWLGLRQEIDTSGGWRLMLEPRAQGTVRLFSERLYFWTLSGVFGIEPLPFRICAFLAQFLNLWLLVRIAWRLTSGSMLASAAAALFYAGSAKMVKPLAWASSFNQILAACCMLGAFSLLLEWIETGNARYWWAQFVVFLLSFGVLESVLVYPVIASLYTLFFARERLLRTLPLWIPSAAFAAWHLFGIERPSSSQYAPVFDEGIFANLAHYTWIALGPENSWVAGLIAALLVAGVLWSALYRKTWLPLFFCAWFVLFLAPVLPFQNRFAEYYVVLPLTGIALCFGLLAAALPLAGRAACAAVAAVLFVYGWASFVEARRGLDWVADRSDRIHRLLDAGVQLSRTKKVDTLLLNGVDTELFTTALQDSPFRLYGINKVYLVPGSETSIRARADLGGVSAYKISLPQAVGLLESGSAAVLSIAGDEIHDATNRYRGVAMSQYLQSRPRQVNVGEPGYESLLGPGWWPIEDKFRWMGKSASVRLGGPIPAGTRLVISGFCPETVASKGPVTLQVRIGEATSAVVASKTLTGVGPFTVSAEVPETTTEWVTARIDVDRVTRLPGDKRDLGLIFGLFTLKLR